MEFCYQVWISSSRNFGYIWPFFWHMRRIENQLQGLFYCRHRTMYVLRTSVKHLCKYWHITGDTKMSSKLHWPTILPFIQDRWKWIYIFTFASFDHFGWGKWVGGRSWERELESGGEEIQDPTISCHCLLQHVRHRGSSLLQNYCESAGHYTIVLRLRWRGSCIGQYDEIWWSDFPSKIHIGGVPY